MRTPQEGNKLRLKRREVGCLAFPHNEGSPTKRPEPFLGCVITRSVTGDLWSPVGDVGFRTGAAPRAAMSMPEQPCTEITARLLEKTKSGLPGKPLACRR